MSDSPIEITEKDLFLPERLKDYQEQMETELMVLLSELALWEKNPSPPKGLKACVHSYFLRDLWTEIAETLIWSTWVRWRVSELEAGRLPGKTNLKISDLMAEKIIFRPDEKLTDRWDFADRVFRGGPGFAAIVGNIPNIAA